MRVHKIRNSTGVSPIGSLFFLLGSLFSLFQPNQGLILIFLDLLLFIISCTLFIFAKFKYFKDTHQKSKDQIAMCVYAILTLIIIIAAAFGIATTYNLSLWCISIGWSLQSLNTRQTQRINAFTILNVILLSMAEIFLFVDSMILSWQEMGFSMWLYFISGFYGLLSFIDFLFYFITYFVRRNEMILPL